jgi:exodeoxyribonuclease VII small subunit
MARPKKEANFEKDLEQLEQIVTALEEGGLPLDESLKRFEDGIKLARRCEKALGEAEKKIEILLKNDAGDLEAQPFGEDEEPDEEAEEDAPAAPPATPKETRAPRDPFEELPPESEDGDEGMLF